MYYLSALHQDFCWVIWYFFFLFSFKLFYCCSSTVVCIYLPPSPPSQPSPPPSPDSTSPWLCPCVLYICSRKPFPPLPLVSLPTSPLVTVRLFFISMSLVTFCLFVCFADQVPVKGEIIWYLSFSAWLISLSIMLSSSIHAVAKGRSSFFLSTAQYSIV